MTDRDARLAYNRLCSRARPNRTWLPEQCQRCESPCKYGTALLHMVGMDREIKDTHQNEKGMVGSSRLRRCVKMFNRNSILK